MSLRSITRLGLFLLTFPLACGPASAGFDVCNKTEYATLVSVGFHRGKDWVSEGWWRVEPKTCKTVVKGDLQSRYFYLRGVHQGVEGVWDGAWNLCVSSRNFSIVGTSQCAKRGFSQARFFEIDTGNKANWVHNLSD